jgi:hypothetical protein
MQTIHVQLAITLGDDAAKALAELLGPALPGSSPACFRLLLGKEHLNPALRSFHLRR